MMNLNAVRAKAENLGVTIPAKKKIDLIRQIQSQEGNLPCFKTRSACDQAECCWRDECLN